jgi:hypothetical protein
MSKTIIKLSFLFIIISLPITKVSACLLRKVFSQHERNIQKLVTIWLGNRPGLYNHEGIWTGALACGETSALSQLVLQHNKIKSTRVMVTNQDNGLDHSFLVVPDKKKLYIVDPTFRQFDLEPQDNNCTLIKKRNSIQPWINSQTKVEDPWWLFYGEGLYTTNQGSYECTIPLQSQLEEMLKRELDEEQAKFKDFINFRNAFKKALINKEFDYNHE